MAPPVLTDATMTKVLVTSFLLASSACGEDGAVSPDAATPDVPFLVGDFSCIDTPWPTVAPDPLFVEGEIISTGTGGPLGAVPVEVRAMDGDALLGQGMTGNTLNTRGKYTVSIATGGVAPRIYRKFTAPNHLDTYAIDPIPQHLQFKYGNAMLDQGFAEQLYQAAGATFDASKGIVNVHIVDCVLPGPADIHAVQGATVEAPPGSHLVYLDPDGNPAPGITQTTSSGQVTLVGVTPGDVDIVVHAGPVTYRAWPIQVRASSFTWLPRHP